MIDGTLQIFTFEKNIPWILLDLKRFLVPRVRLTNTLLDPAGVPNAELDVEPAPWLFNEQFRIALLWRFAGGGRER